MDDYTIKKLMNALQTYNSSLLAIFYVTPLHMNMRCDVHQKRNVCTLAEMREDAS